MKTTFYKKQGRRYVPVSEYDSEVRDAWPKGSHVVVSQPGHTVYKYSINPDYASVIVAALLSKDKMVDTMINKSIGIDSTTALTESEIDIAKQYKQLLINRGIIFLPSYNDIVQAGIDVLIDNAVEHSTNPTVRHSYEQFIEQLKTVLLITNEDTK